MRIPRLAVTLAGGLLVAGLSVGLSGTAHASDPTVPSATWNEIYVPFDDQAGNRLCADVPGGSAAAGLALQFSSCHGYSADGASQQWQFLGSDRPGLGGLVGVFMNPANHLCIGNQGGSLTSGVRLVQEPCHQASGFLIRPEDDNGTNPLLELVLVDRGTDGVTSLCLAAGDTGDHDATPLVATTCQPFPVSAADLQILELA